MQPTFRSDRYFQIPEYFRHFRAMAEAKSPQEKYGATIDVIKLGFVGYQATARELARINKIDAKDLPAAMEEGEKALLFAYVNSIALEGRDFLGDRAEPLVKKFGWNLDEMIEDALFGSVSDTI